MIIVKLINIHKLKNNKSQTKDGLYGVKLTECRPSELSDISDTNPVFVLAGFSFGLFRSELNSSGLSSDIMNIYIVVVEWCFVFLITRTQSQL